MDRKLQDREFFRRDVLCVAPDLVGRILVRRLPDGTLLRARITETEAYRGAQDTACHACHGRTKRTEVLYHDGARSMSTSATACTGCSTS